MLEYKKQRLPFMTSFPGEGAPGLSEVELAQQPRFRERSLDLQPRQQQTQQLSFGSKTSDDSKVPHFIQFYLLEPCERRISQILL